MTIPEWPDATRSLDAFDLTGKRAVVVGAASGVGRAIAVALAEAGCDLALTSLTTDAEEVLALRKTVREVRDAGRIALEQAIDASSGQAAQVMARQVAKELGGIDVLVTAPDLFLGKPATQVSDADWAKVVGRNLSATFFACRAAGKEMLKGGSAELTTGSRGTKGRVIIVSSVLGERGLPNAAAYCAAQGGVLNLARALSQEWAAQGITVNAIAQGWMDGSPALGDPDPQSNQTVRFIPMKRPGHPEEVAPLVVYLASDAAGYITGQVLYVDGGLTVHL
jgi:NAD(P)-dependent dehydrogenase (short-subunit alcohol dehydrogenase family)